MPHCDRPAQNSGRVAHSMHCIFPPPAGAAVITAAPAGGGKMQCMLCATRPLFWAGRSQCGTLKHLASPGHYEAWYVSAREARTIDDQP